MTVFTHICCINCTVLWKIMDFRLSCNTSGFFKSNKLVINGNNSIYSADENTEAAMIY